MDAQAQWEDGDVASQERPIWICPECGARLVTRNLWHSCGSHTLEELFDGAEPGVLETARAFVAMLESLGEVQVIPQKTRLVCVARVRFAGLSPSKSGFVVSFALRRRLDSPRVWKVDDYGPGWQAHWVRIRTIADLDEELSRWLQESHDTVGLQQASTAAPT